MGPSTYPLRSSGNHRLPAVAFGDPGGVATAHRRGGANRRHLGRADAVRRREAWPVRVDTNLEKGSRGVRGRLGAVGVRALLERVRARHRRRRRPDRRRARPRDDRVNHGRLGPKGLYGWQANTPRPADTPLVRRDGELSRPTWDEAMGLVVGALAGAARASTGRSRSASTPAASCSWRSTTRSPSSGKAGIGTPHMDGNTRLCTATAAAALKETLRQPTASRAPTTTSTTATRSLLVGPQHRRDADRAVDRGCSTACAGRDPPRLVVVDPRRTPVARGGRRPSRRPRPARTSRC